MNIVIECCDLCNAPLGDEKNGISIEFGRSIGGWGRRENPVQWQGEVCRKCYAEYETISKAVDGWLEKRHGSKKPTIIVREHDVSTVWADEPQPERRGPECTARG